MVSEPTIPNIKWKIIFLACSCTVVLLIHRCFACSLPSYSLVAALLCQNSCRRHHSSNMHCLLCDTASVPPSLSTTCRCLLHDVAFVRRAIIPVHHVPLTPAWHHHFRRVVAPVHRAPSPFAWCCSCPPLLFRHCNNHLCIVVVVCAVRGRRPFLPVLFIILCILVLCVANAIVCCVTVLVFEILLKVHSW